MEKNPQSGADYVVINIRVPARLLVRLGRWLVLLAATYGLLHH